MSIVVPLLVVSIVIAAIAYFTNAGFGDRRPKDQDSAGDDDPPPHK